MPPPSPSDAQPDPAPALVMLPGTLCDDRLFAPLLPRLLAQLPSVSAPFTYLNPNASSLTEDAAHVLALSPRPMILLGFSLGGILALEVALRAQCTAPGRVHGLFLLSTTARPVPPEHHLPRRTAVTSARRLGLARYTREILWPTYASTPPNLASLPVLEAMATTLGPDIFARQTELALYRRDLRPHLHALRCPTLILAGTDDCVCPPAVQHELAAAIPGSTLHLIPGAGHLLPLDRPDETASAVAAWFQTFQPQPLQPCRVPARP